MCNRESWEAARRVELVIHDELLGLLHEKVAEKEEHVRELRRSLASAETKQLARGRKSRGGSGTPPSSSCPEEERYHLSHGGTLPESSHEEERPPMSPTQTGHSTVSGGPSGVSRLHPPHLLEFYSETADRSREEAYDQWVDKLKKHAELLAWSEREELLQFELRLACRAKSVYELLPAEGKHTFTSAVECLQERL